MDRTKLDPEEESEYIGGASTGTSYAIPLANPAPDRFVPMEGDDDEDLTPDALRSLLEHTNAAVTMESADRSYTVRTSEGAHSVVSSTTDGSPAADTLALALERAERVSAQLAELSTELEEMHEQTQMNKKLLNTHTTTTTTWEKKQNESSQSRMSGSTQQDKQDKVSDSPASPPKSPSPGPSDSPASNLADSRVVVSSLVASPPSSHASPSRGSEGRSDGSPVISLRGQTPPPVEEVKVSVVNRTKVNHRTIESVSLSGAMEPSPPAYISSISPISGIGMLPCSNETTSINSARTDASIASSMAGEGERRRATGSTRHRSTSPALQMRRGSFGAYTSQSPTVIMPTVTSVASTLPAMSPPCYTGRSLSPSVSPMVRSISPVAFPAPTYYAQPQPHPVNLVEVNPMPMRVERTLVAVDRLVPDVSGGLASSPGSATGYSSSALPAYSSPSYSSPSAPYW